MAKGKNSVLVERPQTYLERMKNANIEQVNDLKRPDKVKEIDLLCVHYDKAKNPRTKEEFETNVAELKPLIVAAGGIKDPIRVVKCGVDSEGIVQYRLIHGYTRVEAGHQLIDEGYRKILELVPAFILNENEMSEVEEIKSHVTLNSGKQLTNLSEGKVYWELHNTHIMSQNQIAKELGKTPMHINNMLLLYNGISSEPKLYDFIKSEKTSATTVLNALKNNSANEVLGLLEKASKSLEEQAQNAKAEAEQSKKIAEAKKAEAESDGKQSKGRKPKLDKPEPKAKKKDTKITPEVLKKAQAEIQQGSKINDNKNKGKGEENKPNAERTVLTPLISLKSQLQYKLYNISRDIFTALDEKKMLHNLSPEQIASKISEFAVKLYSENVRG